MYKWINVLFRTQTGLFGSLKLLLLYCTKQPGAPSINILFFLQSTMDNVSKTFTCSLHSVEFSLCMLAALQISDLTLEYISLLLLQCNKQILKCQSHTVTNIDLFTSLKFQGGEGKDWLMYSGSIYWTLLILAGHILKAGSQLGLIVSANIPWA